MQKNYCFVAIFSLFCIGIALSSPVRQFCLEELKSEHNDASSIERLYSSTAENNCLELKVHVARCLDRSLFSLIKTLEPEQMKDKTKAPSITLDKLSNTLSKYINIGIIPGFTQALEKCSHVDQSRGMYTKVISFGDFSRKCACDFGSDQQCRAYRHIGDLMHCGAAMPINNIMQSKNQTISQKSG